MGFWIQDDNGNPIHVNGDDDMPAEAEQAVRELARAAQRWGNEVCVECGSKRIDHQSSDRSRCAVFVGGERGGRDE
jgi:myo-inositol catabolism protein IolC